MKIGDRCFVHGYIDEIRKDTVIVRNDGGYFGTVLSEVTGELPSTQPEWKKGKWIDGSIPTYAVCSECAYQERYAYENNYCPNCGSYNGGEQDGRDS